MSTPTIEAAKPAKAIKAPVKAAPAPTNSPVRQYFPPIKLHATQVYAELREVQYHPVSGEPLIQLPRTGGQFSFLRLLVVNMHAEASGQTGKDILSNRGKPWDREKKKGGDVCRDGVILVSSSAAVAFSTWPLKPYERFASPPVESVVIEDDAGKEVLAAAEAWARHVGVDTEGNPKQKYPKTYEGDLKFASCGALCYPVIEVIFDDNVTMERIWQDHGNRPSFYDPLEGNDVVDGEIISARKAIGIR